MARSERSERKGEHRRMEIKLKSERECTKEKRGGKKGKMRARQLFSDVNEITRKLTRVMQTQWPSKSFPAFIVTASSFSRLSVSAAFSSAFIALIISRIRLLAIRSYAFCCEIFDMNYETVCIPLQALKIGENN